MKLTHALTVNIEGFQSKETAFPACIPILGKPCSGKSTLCAFLSTFQTDECAPILFQHFAAGSCLRDFVANNSNESAFKLREIMERGDVRDGDGFASSFLVANLFHRVALNTIANWDYLSEPHLQNVWMLDGFPRSTLQMQAFLAVYRKLVPVVVVLESNDGVRVERTQMRESRGREAPLHERDQFDETERIIEFLENQGVPVLQISNDSRSISETAAVLAVQLQLNLPNTDI